MAIQKKHSPTGSVSSIESSTKPKFVCPPHLIPNGQISNVAAESMRELTPAPAVDSGASEAPKIPDVGIDPADVRVSVQATEVDEAQPLFSALWRTPQHSHLLGKLDPRTRYFSNFPVNDVLNVVPLANRLCGERSDVYFAVAEFLTNEGRTQANAVGAYGFWADIDCGEQKAAQGRGYATIELALAAVDSFCSETGLPRPNFTVNSGGGLHLHWVMTDFAPKGQWQLYAKKLKAVAAKVGFLADPSRTADIASVMRIPGTLNRKYDPPKPVTLLHSSKDFIANAVMFDAIDRAHEKLCEVLPTMPKSNGLPYTPALPRDAPSGLKDVERKVATMATLLTAIDADCGYEDWRNVLMAIHHESGGSEQGLELADRWSSTASSYPGRQVMEAKWRSFEGGSATPITIGTIKKMVSDAGYDWMEVLAEAGPDFDPPYVEVEVVHPNVLPPPKPSQPIRPVLSTQPGQPVQPVHPLARFSLQGHVTELENMMVEQRPLLGDIVLHGQATAIFAKANTGKTLIILRLIIAAIKEGLIDPSKLVYINMDDNSSGLVEKVRLADEYGFHMVADGHKGFESKEFRAAMEAMIETDSVNGTIVVLDTLKKFVNTMDKGKSSNFAKVVRQFVLKGGTVIALAHANKNPGPDGKIVYSGTTDIVDDFDCAYTLATVAGQPGGSERVVEFTNIKRRGNVALTAAYAYSLERGLSYSALLFSVQEVDPNQLGPIKRAAELQSDATVIAAIHACIAQGITSKMKLVDAAAERAQVSQRNTLRVVEKFTGDNPTQHQWRYVVRERGAKVFESLKPPPREGPGTAST